MSAIEHRPIRFDKEDGDFVCRLNGSLKYAHYSKINRLGWVVVTVVDQSKIINPIIFKIIVSILLVGLLSAILGTALSVTLSKLIVTSLVALKKNVRETVVNGHTYDSNGKYPKNEIGIIASDIEHLAENEVLKKNAALKEANEKLEALFQTDQLTELYNRRKLEMALRTELKRAMRYKSKFSVIMFDIDWFKKINDVYGHLTGDEILKEIAGLTKKMFRSTDIISRWGGEEFLILCSETDLETKQPGSWPRSCVAPLKIIHSLSVPVCVPMLTR